MKVYQKHAAKVITKFPVLVVHAMTAAISKAIELHLWIMEEYPYLKAKVETDSVPTLISQDGKQELQERSAIHITLTKNA